MSDRIRVQLTFVLDVDAGEDITMHENINDTFEAATHKLFPKLVKADIEPNGRLVITKLRLKSKHVKFDAVYRLLAEKSRVRAKECQ